MAMESVTALMASTLEAEAALMASTKERWAAPKIIFAPSSDARAMAVAKRYHCD
jgi:hypothetical protein